MPSRRRGLPATRKRVLDAGIRVWIDTDPATLFGGLNVSRLAREAGITRATFYTYWATTQDYLDELTEHISERVGIDPKDSDFADRMTTLTLGSGPVAEELVWLAGRLMRDLADDPALRLRLAMLSKGDDPVVAAKLQDQYARQEAELMAFYQRNLDRWGRMPTPPLTLADIAALYTALMEGYAARMVIDPERAKPEHYGYAALALLMTLTAPTERPRDALTTVRAVDGWAAEGDQARAAVVGRDLARSAAAEGHVDPLEVAHYTALDLAYRPWSEIGLGSVAQMMQTSPVELANLFGSKHGLGVAVLHLQASRAYQAVPQDPDPLRHLRRLLGAGEEVLRRSPALARSALAVLTGQAAGAAPGVVSWDVTDQLRATVARAMAAGRLRTDMSAAEVATTLTVALVTQQSPVLVNGRYPTGDLVEMILRGAGAEPAAAPAEPGAPEWPPSTSTTIPPPDPAAIPPPTSADAAIPSRTPRAPSPSLDGVDPGRAST